MSLTEYALYERKWRDFPELAKLLDEKIIGVDWTGPSSVSDSIFDQMNRILEIYALVQENKNIIEHAVIQIGDPLRRDLLKLSQALAWASEIFSGASHLSNQLACRE